jgi:protoporphyrinogen oxidase
MSAEAGSPARVAVVGAGLAGLRAAWQLVRRGFDVAVYEAREEIGGRAGGQWQSGHWMDSAWPVLDAKNASLLRWAVELGLGDDMLPLRPVQVNASADRFHNLPCNLINISEPVAGSCACSAFAMVEADHQSVSLTFN